MSETRGLPAYPPAVNAWSYPRPPIAPRWKWITIAVIVAASLIAGGLVAALIVLDHTDSPGTIEDARIIRVIDQQCPIMTATVESLRITGGPRQEARTIIEQNRAVEIMVGAVLRVAPSVRAGDPPTDDWLRDWERLVTARATYADQLLRGTDESFRVPMGPDGEDLDRRMNRAAPDSDEVCEVPRALLDLTPDDASDV